MAMTSSQDLGHKNYYLYRDSDGTGEWAILPWDVDLTLGPQLGGQHRLFQRHRFHQQRAEFL